jgi:hypothetical protein
MLALGLHASGMSASLVAAEDGPTARTQQVIRMNLKLMEAPAAAAMLTTSTAFAGGTNLVVGGDFESVPRGSQGTECHSTLLPSIPGWTASLGWQTDRFRNLDCASGCVPLHESGGNYSVSLQGSVCCGCNNNGYIEQLLSTRANTRYRLAFDVALDESDLLRLDVGSQTEQFVWTGVVEWRTVSRDFIAAGPTLLRFESLSASTFTPSGCNGCWEGEGCVLDNISVVALPACPADVIENGIVDGADLAAVLTVWGTDGGIYPRADANGDGVVNGADLAVVLGAWGVCQ